MRFLKTGLEQAKVTIKKVKAQVWVVAEVEAEVKKNLPKDGFMYYMEYSHVSYKISVAQNAKNLAIKEKIAFVLFLRLSEE